ncbi:MULTISPECIES: hypothetical protein [Mesorhizobium]|uniref:hypothetical protein n=1 Tax=Mesorhizobium TaxID=68287 RepID=UPI000801E9CE|nr:MULTISPECIES: hypothetical protein [Mesorhizobium]MUT27253.1 hypothetical protein [Mesorhizobium japonicum]OBQ83715.1 hypothetical protein A9K71_23085 [Mesorhizobium sp. WSM3873]
MAIATALYPLGSASRKAGDLVSAYAWLNAYAARGSANPDTIELRDGIAGQMSSDQVQERSTAWCETAGGR